MMCLWVGLHNKPLSFSFKHTSQASTPSGLYHDGIQQAATANELDHGVVQIAQFLPEVFTQFKGARSASFSSFTTSKSGFCYCAGQRESAEGGTMLSGFDLQHDFSVCQYRRNR